MIDFMSWARLGPKDGHFIVFTLFSGPFQAEKIVNVLDFGLGPIPDTPIRGYRHTMDFYDEFDEPKI